MTTLDIQPGLRFLIVRPIAVVEPAGEDFQVDSAAAAAIDPNAGESPPVMLELAVTVVERAKWVVDHWSCLTDDGRKLIVHPDDFLRPLPPPE
jgi:hypothetical protein